MQCEDSVVLQALDVVCCERLVVVDYAFVTLADQHPIWRRDRFFLWREKGRMRVGQKQLAPTATKPLTSRLHIVTARQAFLSPSEGERRTFR